MRYLSIAIPIILLVVSSIQVLAQQTPLLASTDVFRPDSIASVKKTSISSLREVNLDEIPFNVIVLSKEEIKASGARDLLEILLLIPGFSAGVDVDEVIGLGIRGQWAHEGKYLIMLNNIPLNELDFGTFSLGQRIMLNSVDRIEIIMGPGSVIYGGTAELGVINIVTNELGNTGANVFSSAAVDEQGINRTTYGLSGKHFLGNETYLTYNGSFTEGARSNQLISTNDISTNYLDSTQSINSEIFLRLRHKNLSFSYLFNNYIFNVTNAEYGVQMLTNSVQVDYKKKLSSKHALFVRSTITYQLPWTYKNTSDPIRLESNTRARSFLNSINLNSKLDANIQSTFGIQLFRNINMGEDGGRFQPIRLWDIPRDTPNEMYGAALFGDASYNFKSATFQAGFRSEINNNVNAQFTPRFGITYKINRILIRANYSNAFKIPTLQNLSLGPEDKPLETEVSQNSEVILQYSTKNGFSLALSAYLLTIRNPIVYVSDSIVLDRYINRKRIATYGGDFWIEHESAKNLFRVAYNFSQLNNLETDLPEIEINNSNSIQGLPSHVVTVIAQHTWNDTFKTSISGRYQSELATFDYSTNDEGQLIALPAIALLNAQCSFSFKKIDALNIQLAVSNILNERFLLASPYNYGTPAFPLSGRQYSITLNYELFK